MCPVYFQVVHHCHVGVRCLTNNSLWLYFLSRQSPVFTLSSFIAGKPNDKQIAWPPYYRFTIYDERCSTVVCLWKGHTVQHRYQTARSRVLPRQTVVAQPSLNPLNPELNPICYLLALLGAHHFLHVSRISVKSLTLRLLMSCIYIYIYGAPILDVSRSHTTTQHSR